MKCNALKRILIQDFSPDIDRLEIEVKFFESTQKQGESVKQLVTKFFKLNAELKLN